MSEISTRDAIDYPKPGIPRLNRILRNNFKSVYLNREVTVEVILPPDYDSNPHTNYNVLYVLDGQNTEELGLEGILSRLFNSQKIHPIITVGVHAGKRIEEYGVSTTPDYASRGNKARLHLLFFCNELVPYIDNTFRTSRKASGTAILGFSLSGLTAFDMIWSRPDYFSMAGICSGSFWWRKKKLGKDYQQSDRIMHARIQESTRKPGLKFWLQTGNSDESEDRDHDGIIDSIGDTLDIISELEKKGYAKNIDIRYVEVVDGKHDYATWTRVIPDFLIWAFGR